MKVNEMPLNVGSLGCPDCGTKGIERNMNAACNIKSIKAC